MKRKNTQSWKRVSKKIAESCLFLSSSGINFVGCGIPMGDFPESDRGTGVREFTGEGGRAKGVVVVVVVVVVGLRAAGREFLREEVVVVEGRSEDGLDNVTAGRETTTRRILRVRPVETEF
jgi:hypothetical protein